jgi:hypothetical protein
MLMVEIGSWPRDLCLGDPISLPLHHEVTQYCCVFLIILGPGMFLDFFSDCWCYWLNFGMCHLSKLWGDGLIFIFLGPLFRLYCAMLGHQWHILGQKSANFAMSPLSPKNALKKIKLYFGILWQFLFFCNSG